MVLVVDVLAGSVGAVIVVVTTLSAVRTVVLPRGEPVRLTASVFRATRVLFDVRVRHSTSYAASDRVMALYAPVALIALPMAWLALVTGGYTLVLWAAGVRPLSLAFVTSGSSLLTLGFERPEGVLPVVLSFTEAALGLAVLAILLVTYLPSMYAAFARREQAVALLEVRAGAPPTGVELLTRAARIRGLQSLDPIWSAWEVWFADVLESHTSLPALTYFRSPQPDQSWVTAAGAVLDAAALLVSSVDLTRVLDEDAEIRLPEAEICIRAGYLALRGVADFFRLPHDPDPAPTDPIAVTRPEYDDALRAMAEAGVPLRDDREAAWRAFAGWRVNYDTALIELAALTMAPYAPWSSDRSPVLEPGGARRRLPAVRPTV